MLDARSDKVLGLAPAQVHAKDKPIPREGDEVWESDALLHRVAELTIGYAGADLANLLNEASILMVCLPIPPPAHLARFKCPLPVQSGRASVPSGQQSSGGSLRNGGARRQSMQQQGGPECLAGKVGNLDTIVQRIDCSICLIALSSCSVAGGVGQAEST